MRATAAAAAAAAAAAGTIAQMRPTGRGGVGRRDGEAGDSNKKKKSIRTSHHSGVKVAAGFKLPTLITAGVADEPHESFTPVAAMWRCGAASNTQFSRGSSEVPHE